MATREDNPFTGHKAVGVVHNPQHDLESFWWILLWSITARIDNVKSKEFVKSIFVNSIDDSQAREHCLKKGVRFEDYFNERLHAQFPVYMEGMRATLISNYWQRPVDRPQDPQSLVIVHNVFDIALTILHESNDADWHTMPLKIDGEKPASTPKDFVRETSNLQKPGRKRPRRPRDADEYEDSDASNENTRPPSKRTR